MSDEEYDVSDEEVEEEEEVTDLSNRYVMRSFIRRLICYHFPTFVL